MNSAIIAPLNLVIEWILNNTVACGNFTPECEDLDNRRTILLGRSWLLSLPHTIRGEKLLTFYRKYVASIDK